MTLQEAKDRYTEIRSESAEVERFYNLGIYTHTEYAYRFNELNAEARKVQLVIKSLEDARQLVHDVMRDGDFGRSRQIREEELRQAAERMQSRPSRQWIDKVLVPVFWLMDFMDWGIIQMLYRLAVLALLGAILYKLY